MLHRVGVGIGIGIGCWLSLRRGGTFWLSVCRRGGALLLAVGRLHRVIHSEVGRVASMRCGGLRGTRVFKQPPKSALMFEKERNYAHVR